MKILNKSIHIDPFFKSISKGSLLMLDYDGTLAPLVKERMQAFPYPGVKEKLLSLMNKKNTRIVIISGRSLDDLETLLNMPPNLELWGSHGFERKLDGKKTSVPLDDKLREGLNEGIKVCKDKVDASQCEIKPYAIAIHWREVNSLEKLPVYNQIYQAWEKICSFRNLEIHPFDGGLELRPKGRNKKNVVQELLAEVPQKTAIAYLGDDNTDEEAFEALGNKGLKVLVREQLRPTLADIQLIPPQELLSFLDQWKGTL
jgi:trehalose 6-phosphate phosphatase